MKFARSRRFNTLVGTVSFAIALSVPHVYAHADVSDWQRGASIQPTSPTQFAEPAFKQSLQNLKNDNATYVNLVIPIYQNDLHAADIFAGSDTPTDQTIATAIDTAHSLGLKVSLKPHIESKTYEWRAGIDPYDRTAWFANYGRFIQRYATIAQAHHAEQFIVGTELIDLASDDFNPQNTSSWRTLIHTVRNIFSGSVTYAANWGTGSSDEKNRITFWDALDYAGIDAYYPLGTDYTDTSVEHYRAYWAQTDQNDIQPFMKKIGGKPILFTEVGYRSTSGSHVTPGIYQHIDGVNMTEQANAYEALYEYWNDKPGIAGMHMWDWDANPNAGGLTNNDYTPQGKPAEAVMKKWFGLTGHISYAGAVVNTTAPNLSTVSIVSSPMIVDTQGTVTTKISNAAGDLSYAVVDMEVYDSSGNRVAQHFVENQTLTASIPMSYPLSWIPTAPGTYTLKVGVFNATWLKNYLWQDNALQFQASSSITVTPPSPTPAPIPVGSPPQGAYDAIATIDSAVPSVLVPSTINAIVKNNNGTSTVLVDMEIYNSSGIKVGQKVFQNEVFNAGQSKNYVLSFVPQTPDTYSIKVGIFSNGWAQNYLWKDPAGKFTVSPPALVAVPPVAVSPAPAPAPAPVVTVVSPPTPTPSYSLNIWWPTNLAHVSGQIPLKAIVDQLSLSQYMMYWQVDGGTLVAMHDSSVDYPHKEAVIDVTNWNWKAPGASYRLTFVAKNSSGVVLTQKDTAIIIGP